MSGGRLIWRWAFFFVCFIVIALDESKLNYFCGTNIFSHTKIALSLITSPFSHWMTKLLIDCYFFVEMVQPKPSVRLKQISRIISRQNEDDNSSVTSSCLSIIAILIIIFITGIIMFVCGIITVTSCKESLLPIWLLVRLMLWKEGPNFFSETFNNFP